MSIDRSYRRRGIASLLLNALISYARDHGAKKVVLSTTSWQASAIKMYERFGWVDVRQECFSWLTRSGKIHFLELDI
jgi:ribosomal-protein-alanine N-acetyltransferase